MKKQPIITAVFIASVSAILLLIAYVGGEAIAEHMGRPQRGGIGWSIGVQIIIAAFFVVSLVQNCVLRLSRISKIKTTIITMLIFTAISFVFFGNQFSGKGWAHPYRYIYIMAFSYIILLLPIMKQLMRKSTWTK